jgi:hypothetical protein
LFCQQVSSEWDLPRFLCHVSQNQWVRMIWKMKSKENGAESEDGAENEA